MLRRFVGVMLVAFLVALTGCITSDSPALSSKSAQDVGKQLTYHIYSSRSSSDDWLLFRRQRGASYQMLLSGGGGESVFASDVLLRRLATRNSSPVYLVQIAASGMDDPDFAGPSYESSGAPKYLLFLVNVAEGGAGYVAWVPCGAHDLVAAVRSAGGRLVCDAGLIDEDMPRLGAGMSETEVRKVFMELLTSGALQWEDNTQRGLLDGIE